MENQSVVFIPESTQEQYRSELRRMYLENYRTFRKDELKNSLRAYFFFLERHITGEDKTAYAGYDFTVEELEAVISEMEPLYVQMSDTKERSAQILTSLK